MIRPNGKSFIFFVLFLFLSTNAYSYTIVPCTEGETGTCRLAANLTTLEIQSVINASLPSDGNYYRDGVYLPSGTVPWSNVLHLNKAGLVLKGAGSSSTVINIGNFNYALTLEAQRIRITGIHFITTSGSGYLVGWTSDCSNFRIDNNLFTGSIVNYLFWLGYKGVIDNNVINTAMGGGILYSTQSETFILERVDFTNFTTKPWIFFEDNTVNMVSIGAELLENDDGGYLYIRHNVFNEQSGQGTERNTLFEQHNRSPGYGGRVQIVHDNRVNYANIGDASFRTQYWRHGTGLLYNNIFDYSAAELDPDQPPGETGHAIFMLRAYRASSSCDDGSTNTANVHSTTNPYFTSTMVARCCRTTYNTGGYQGEGYPCVGQPGTGYWGDGQGQEPIYYWNNTKTANGITFVPITSVLVESPESTYVALNREYCVGTTQPASCGGVALNYTPFQYPHPLRGSIVPDTNPPTGNVTSPAASFACTSNPMQVLESLSSNEASTWRFATSAEYAAGADTYEEMVSTGTYTTTGGLTHSRTVSRACGATYTMKSLGIDTSGNKGTAPDYLVTTTYTIGEETPEEPTFISGTKFGENSAASIHAVITDTYLNDGDETNKSGSYSLAFYTDPGATVSNDSILKFNLTSIPAGSTINAARVYLWLTSSGGDASYEISAHRITGDDPVITSCSWLTYNGTDSWGATPGGLGDVAAYESYTAVGTTLQWYSWDLTATVTAWLTSNKGLLMAGDQTSNKATANSFRYFASSNHTDQSIRPILVVDYTVPAGTSQTFTFTMDSEGAYSITPTESGNATITLQ